MSRRVKVRGQWKADEEIASESQRKEVHMTCVKVFRFDPSKDKEPRYDTFKVPLLENMSVLGVLHHIYEKMDSSLAFYFSCRGSYNKCGGCMMLVNGKAIMACDAPAESEMKIDPLPKKKIIRDLVVEF